MKDLGLVILAGIIVLFLSAYVIFVGGYTASCIWSWYAVPRGLPAIAWNEFAAAFMLTQLFKGGTAEKKKEETEEDREARRWKAVGTLLAPWFALLVAWVIR